MKRFFVTFFSVGSSFSSFIVGMCSGNGNQPNPLLTQVQSELPGGPWTSRLYIYLQDRRIISFSVVNMTEKSRCCQVDLGQFF